MIRGNPESQQDLERIRRLEDSQRLLRDEVGDVRRDIRALIDIAAAQRSEVSAIFNFLQKSDAVLTASMDG